ncbi:hypothetical protein GCM10018980_77210 [Streptomyces capoamus]|uniref:Uncharacterized protein n=1 Tax=Streptomyces capoamus TaxID=68183 RepID=A0A919F418_9ACTN|nr:hypothetical protein GCM10018980_77210 [Streptomyces capoamus]
MLRRRRPEALKQPAQALPTAGRDTWAEDRDAAFYVALYLRAAQYSLHHDCPMTYA